MSFNQGQNEYFFTSFHPGLKIYFQRFAAYFTKIFYGKNTFTGLYKNYDDFTNNRGKMFNFKTFQIVLLAKIN